MLPGAVFQYFNKGNPATIGRAKAIADFGRVHVTGFVAWIVWLFVHSLNLVGFRHRLRSCCSGPRPTSRISAGCG